MVCHDPDINWTYVGGIRSTGYSASSAIGEYVADLISDKVQVGTDYEF